MAANLTKSTAPGGYAALPILVTMTASQGGDAQDQFASSGNDFLIAHNTTGGTLHIGLETIANIWGRTNNIVAHDIVAGAIHMYGPFKNPGWIQADGTIRVSSEGAGIKFGIITLP